MRMRPMVAVLSYMQGESENYVYVSLFPYLMTKL